MRLTYPTSMNRPMDDDKDIHRNVRLKHKVMIMCMIDEVDNATCNEIEKLLDLPHQSASARISELYKQGKIYDTGLKRLTEYGTPARVYSVSEKYKELFKK